jgi:nicotinamidase-related amidase
MSPLRSVAAGAAAERLSLADELKANSLALAKAAKALNIPLVLTSSMESYAQGPLLAELEEIAPAEHAGRIQRQGVVNAMDDENFAAAVRESGRRKLIIAGVTNDVCTVFPTLTALAEGY